MNRVLQHIFPVILASQSQSRATMLRNAGVHFSIQPSYIDESLIKNKAKASKTSIEQCAQDLAIAKAMKVSERFPDTYIIGADQMMVCENRWFDKPKDLTAAKQQLKFLRGNWHTVITATCVVKAKVVLWQSLSNSKLKMHNFSDAFIDNYLSSLGNETLNSVGCYQLENIGIKLFEKIEGDMFAIMGMPVIHLLNFFRAENVIDV